MSFQFGKKNMKKCLICIQGGSASRGFHFYAVFEWDIKIAEKPRNQQQE